MWKFWQKPAVMLLSKEITLYLGKERGLNKQSAASLRVVEKHGRYSGRKVTFFRVFDPATANVAGFDVHSFDALDERGVLYSGYTESNGQIVLDGQRQTMSVQEAAKALRVWKMAHEDVHGTVENP